MRDGSAVLMPRPLLTLLICTIVAAAACGSSTTEVGTANSFVADATVTDTTTTDADTTGTATDTDTEAAAESSAGTSPSSGASESTQGATADDAAAVSNATDTAISNLATPVPLESGTDETGGTGLAPATVRRDDEQPPDFPRPNEPPGRPRITIDTNPHDQAPASTNALQDQPQESGTAQVGQAPREPATPPPSPVPTATPEPDDPPEPDDRDPLPSVGDGETLRPPVEGGTGTVGPAPGLPIDPGSGPLPEPAPTVLPTPQSVAPALPTPVPIPEPIPTPLIALQLIPTPVPDPGPEYLQADAIVATQLADIVAEALGQPAVAGGGDLAPDVQRPANDGLGIADPTAAVAAVLQAGLLGETPEVGLAPQQLVTEMIVEQIIDPDDSP